MLSAHHVPGNFGHNVNQYTTPPRLDFAEILGSFFAVSSVNSDASHKSMPREDATEAMVVASFTLRCHCVASPSVNAREAASPAQCSAFALRG
jgi:hypothetical protein